MKNEAIIIEIDDKIIGTRDELLIYMRNEMANVCADSSIDMENYARILVEDSNIYNQLVYDYLDNNSLLCIYENVMGEIDIKEIEI